MVTDESPLRTLFRPDEIEMLVCGSKVGSAAISTAVVFAFIVLQGDPLKLPEPHLCRFFFVFFFLSNKSSVLFPFVHLQNWSFVNAFRNWLGFKAWFPSNLQHLDFNALEEATDYDGGFTPDSATVKWVTWSQIWIREEWVDDGAQVSWSLWVCVLFSDIFGRLCTNLRRKRRSCCCSSRPGVIGFQSEGWRNWNSLSRGTDQTPIGCSLLHLVNTPLKTTQLLTLISQKNLAKVFEMWYEWKIR